MSDTPGRMARPSTGMPVHPAAKAGVLLPAFAAEILPEIQLWPVSSRYVQAQSAKTISATHSRNSRKDGLAAAFALVMRRSMREAGQ